MEFSMAERDEAGRQLPSDCTEESGNVHLSKHKTATLLGVESRHGLLE
jgi:hypothetical protein